MFALSALWSLALLRSAFAVRVVKRGDDVATTGSDKIDADMRTRDGLATLDFAEADAEEEAGDDAPTFAEMAAEEAEQEEVGVFETRRRNRRRRRVVKRRDDVATKGSDKIDADMRTRDGLATLDLAEADAEEEAGDDAPTFAEMAAEEAEQEEVGVFKRRRRNRRRRTDRRRDRRRRDRRRRQVTSCARDYAVVRALNKCCKVGVSGQWSFYSSIASSETVSISYGYSENRQTFDLDSVYRSAMGSAQASFRTLRYSGGAQVSGSIAEMVVSQTYINTAVNFNMTWTATWTNDDGRYLYQWVWTTQFGVDGDQACRTLSDARVGTRKIVQADTTPRCLPGANLDAQYRRCLPEGQLPP